MLPNGLIFVISIGAAVFWFHESEGNRVVIRRHHVGPRPTKAWVMADQKARVITEVRTVTRIVYVKVTHPPEVHEEETEPTTRKKKKRTTTTSPEPEEIIEEETTTTTTKIIYY